ncbi:stress response protein NST1-like isoform X2 [Bradysia coprophila]|uniref:stress response protein NST1-like isoform X2 n=1 Tax=Bradysia coprophila TaxID=38358 RepID=UPI00187D7D97|nr:stress response protein NST1-like isoform X2 [Bradysia coprophila]
MTVNIMGCCTRTVLFTSFRGFSPATTTNTIIDGSCIFILSFYLQLQSSRKRAAGEEEGRDREEREELLRAYDTDSSSSNDMDPVAKKFKADGLEDTDDVRNDEEEPYHEEMLVQELKGLFIEKRKLCAQEEDLDQEMEKKFKEMEKKIKEMEKQHQAARDDLKRKKDDIDNQIAMKRSRMKPRKSRPTGSR